MKFTRLYTLLLGSAFSLIRFDLKRLKGFIQPTQVWGLYYKLMGLPFHSYLRSFTAVFFHPLSVQNCGFFFVSGLTFQASEVMPPWVLSVMANVSEFLAWWTNYVVVPLKSTVVLPLKGIVSGLSQYLQNTFPLISDFIRDFYIIWPEFHYDSAFLLSILFLPGACALFVLTCGRFVNAKGVLFLNLVATLLVVAHSLFLVWNHQELLSKPIFFTALKFCNQLDNSREWVYTFYNWEIMYDLLSASMWSLVSIVALLVHFYSYNYLLKDPHLVRFLGYLNLFIFFMLFLVCSDNLTQFFFAWEGVGICSYLLVGFWSTRLQASKAALKAVLVNKVGDVGLLFAIAYSWNTFRVSTFSQYDKVFTQFAGTYLTSETPMGLNIVYYSLTLICLGYLLAAVAKSAQLGLHTWLPDAMEGPTPVSALIHAATMVTAGIFLILRIASLLSLLPAILLSALILGSFTALMSGFIASYQTDLKKIIAYSTCSQLGYMFFACGLTLYSASLFHLLSHGFFKALLFLVAGSVIHLHLNEQSLSRLPVFENIKITSLITISMYIGFASLTALPFFSGFYSKEPILQLGGFAFYSNTWVSGALGYNFGLFAAILTSVYSAAAFEEILSTNPKRLRSNTIHRGLPLSSRVSLTLLSVFSLFFGFLGHTTLTEQFKAYFTAQEFVFLSLSAGTPESRIASFSTVSNSLPLLIDVLPLLLCLLLTGIPRMNFYRLYTKNSIFYNTFYLEYFSLFDRLSKCFLGLSHRWGLNKFWFDYVYNTLSTLGLHFGYTSVLKALDKGVLEYFGPTTSSTFIKKIGYFAKFTTYKISLEALYLVSFFLVINWVLFL